MSNITIDKSYKLRVNHFRERWLECVVDYDCGGAEPVPVPVYDAWYRYAPGSLVFRDHAGNTMLSVSLGASYDSWEVDPEPDPHPCPPISGWAGAWSLSGVCAWDGAGGAGSFDDEVLAGGVMDMYDDNPEFNCDFVNRWPITFEEAAAVWDEWDEVEVRIQGTFEPIIGSEMGSPSDTEYEVYTIDQNPHALVPTTGTLDYEPVDDVTITITYHGTEEVITLNADTYGSDAAFRAALRNAWSVGAYWTETYAPSWFPTAATGGIDEPRFAGEAYLDGFGSGTSSAEADYTGYAKVTVDYAGAEAHVKFYGCNQCDALCGAAFTVFPFKVTYDGSVSDYQTGTPQITLAEQEGGVYETASGSEIDKQINYEGYWSAFVGSAAEDAKNDLNAWDGASRRHSHGPGVVSNLSALQEPYWEETGEGNGDWHHDGRIECTESILSAAESDGILLSVADQADVLAFDTTSGWSVSPAGQVTLSVNGEGYLQAVVDVAVPTFATITKTVSGELLATRYAEVDYTSDDDDVNSVGLTVDSAWVDWTPILPDTSRKKNRIDLLAGASVGDSDVTQTCRNLDPTTDACSWGWGVWNFTAIRFGMLRPGKTYVFKHLRKVRPASGEGKSLQLIVIPQGGFHKDTAGASDGEDAYTRFYDGSANYYNRNGYLLVDGALVEIMSARHYTYNPGGGLVWAQEYYDFSDTNILWPHNSWLSKSVLNDNAAVLLVDGNTSSTSSLKRGTESRFTTVAVAACHGDVSLGFDKSFHGRFLVRVAAMTNTPPGPFKIIVTPTHNGVEQDTVEFYTDRLGVGLSPPLPQSTDGHTYTYALEVDGQDTEVSVSGLSLRNRNLTLVTLCATPVEAEYIPGLDAREVVADKRDLVIAADAAGEVSLYRVAHDGEPEQIETTIGGALFPRLNVYDDGFIEAVFANLSSNEAAAISSLDEFTSAPTFYSIGTPDAPGSWDGVMQVDCVQCLGAGIDLAGLRNSGRSLLFVLHKTAGDETGHICALPVGPQGTAAEFDGWSELITDDVPRGGMAACRGYDGSAVLFYCDGSNIKAAVLPVEGNIDGAQTSTVTTQGNSRHLNVAVGGAADVYWLVSWESDSEQLRLRLLQRSGLVWSVEYDVMLDDIAVVDGSLPSAPVIEQRAAVLASSTGALRVFWFDDADVMQATILEGTSHA